MQNRISYNILSFGSFLGAVNGLSRLRVIIFQVSTCSVVSNFFHTCMPKNAIKLPSFHGTYDGYLKRIKSGIEPIRAKMVEDLRLEEVDRTTLTLEPSVIRCL